MNSSDVHERRRLTASILKNKFGNVRSDQFHQRHQDRDPLTGATDIDDYEFMDAGQQQVTVTPQKPNRAAHYATTIQSDSNSRFPVKASNINPNERRYSPGNPMRYQKNRNIDNTNQRQCLGTLIEDESDDSETGTNRVEHHYRRRDSVQYQVNNNDNKSITCGNEKLEHSGNFSELADEFKRRLSLPNETSIPDSFFIKHKDNLTNAPEQLSRIDRRRSLFDIGFGKPATYSKLHVLGAGTYSIVYKGVSRLTNKVVALKEINLEREEGVPFTAIREVSLLKQLKHSNIITLHDIIYTRKTLTLVFEFVDRDLSRYMDECDYKINLDNVRLYLFQLLRALKYCHDRKILHRDIKPQNILISAVGELKLADFGLARAKSFPTKTYTDEVVTLWYRPPDVLLGNVDYGTCIDMWGVGCIFFEVANGHTLFISTATKKQIECIFEILGTPSEADWPGVNLELKYNEINIQRYQGRDLASMAPRLDESGIELLSMFLKCNPKQRISAKEALHHRYFAPLPPAIYDLADTESIFSLPEIKVAEEQTCNNSRQYNIDV